MKAKAPSDSAIETRHIVMPAHVNPLMTLFGGEMAAWIDVSASMAAHKHAGQVCVTASIDSLSYDAPVRMGDHVVCRACVHYVGTTSMEVGVVVVVDEITTGESRPVTYAHLTFVSVNGQGQPQPVPPLVPETDEEKRLYENAKIRVQARRELRKKLK
jgi:acyl-CoA hydrolase